MDIYKDLILDDEYKLRVSSKRLKSGRYQVKFYATIHQRRELYGYLLVSADETLKNVITKIRSRLKAMDIGDGLLLNNMVSDSCLETNFMIFQ